MANPLLRVSRDTSRELYAPPVDADVMADVGLSQRYYVDTTALERATPGKVLQGDAVKVAAMDKYMRQRQALAARGRWEGAVLAGAQAVAYDYDKNPWGMGVPRAVQPSLQRAQRLLGAAAPSAVAESLVFRALDPTPFGVVGMPSGYALRTPRGEYFNGLVLDGFLDPTDPKATALDRAALAGPARGLGLNIGERPGVGSTKRFGAVRPQLADPASWEPRFTSQRRAGGSDGAAYPVDAADDLLVAETARIAAGHDEAPSDPRAVVPARSNYANWAWPSGVSAGLRPGRDTVEGLLGVTPAGSPLRPIRLLTYAQASAQQKLGTHVHHGSRARWGSPWAEETEVPAAADPRNPPLGSPAAKGLSVYYGGRAARHAAVVSEPPQDPDQSLPPLDPSRIRYDFELKETSAVPALLIVLAAVLLGVLLVLLWPRPRRTGTASPRAARDVRGGGCGCGMP